MEKLDTGVTKKRSLSIEPDDEKNEEVHPQKLKTEAGSKPISFDLMKKKSNIKPISINLKAQKNLSSTTTTLKTPSKSVAAVFNDEEEEPEEMPREARMRMRNFGRDTPTSAGPNSFGKTKHGFCDMKKVFEKQLREVAEKHADN
nr:PREDICTED: PEST proteolytic signal-containing nuclear protein-like [Bemisia tabaci]